MPFLLFFMTLPLVAALGYDFYLYQMDPARGFEFSALGFIWTKHHPESYQQVIDMLPPEQWESLNELLTYKAAYVTLAFAIVGYAIALILGIIGLGKKEKA